MRNHYCAKLASTLKKNMSSIEDATTMDGDHNAYKECTQASRTGGEQKNNVQNYGTLVVRETQRQNVGLAARLPRLTSIQVGVML